MWFQQGHAFPTIDTRHQMCIRDSIEGEIVVDGEVLKRRDGMGVYDTNSFELETLKDSHILLIEVPM